MNREHLVLNVSYYLFRHVRISDYTNIKLYQYIKILNRKFSVGLENREFKQMYIEVK